MDRDHTDHVRFAPLQTDYSAALCQELQLPIDLSTAYYITTTHGDSHPASTEEEDDGSSGRANQHSTIVVVHQHSSSILYMFAHMGFPYDRLRPLLLGIPLVVRDGCYGIFARNRGSIWKIVKRVTGMGDTQMDAVRGKLVGLPEKEEDIPFDWGLQDREKHL